MKGHRSVILFIAVLNVGNLNSAITQRWSNAAIDEWIDGLENAFNTAQAFGDDTCMEILGSAGAGYSRADEVKWNNQLRKTHGANGLTTIWFSGRTVIQIDRGSDNVARTLIHEGMHASQQYTETEVHDMQTSIQNCAETYFRQ